MQRISSVNAKPGVLCEQRNPDGFRGFRVPCQPPGGLEVLFVRVGGDPREAAHAYSPPMPVPVPTRAVSVFLLAQQRMCSVFLLHADVPRLTYASPRFYLLFFRACKLASSAAVPMVSRATCRVSCYMCMLPTAPPLSVFCVSQNASAVEGMQFLCHYYKDKGDYPRANKMAEGLLDYTGTVTRLHLFGFWERGNALIHVYNMPGVFVWAASVSEETHT